MEVFLINSLKKLDFYWEVTRKESYFCVTVNYQPISDILYMIKILHPLILSILSSFYNNIQGDQSYCRPLVLKEAL